MARVGYAEYLNEVGEISCYPTSCASNELDNTKFHLPSSDIQRIQRVCHYISYLFNDRSIKYAFIPIEKVTF